MFFHQRHRQSTGHRVEGDADAGEVGAEVGVARVVAAVADPPGMRVSRLLLEADGAAAGADPLGDLAKAKTGAAPNEPFTFFVQVGAFRTAEDAEGQRAKLLLSGIESKVTEREQSGRTVFRVRVGPFDKKDDAEKAKTMKFEIPGGVRRGSEHGDLGCLLSLAHGVLPGARSPTSVGAPRMP